jgi:hypothetical protein
MGSDTRWLAAPACVHLEELFVNRLFFVAPVAAAALSLSAVTAFANEPPKPASVDCVALSNQLASQKAQLEQDQNTLNLAKNELVNAKTETEKAKVNNEIENAQGAVQKDQASVQQTQSQTTNQNVCSGTPAPSSSGTPAPKSPSAPSESGAGQGQPKDNSHDKSRGHGPTYNCVAISNEAAAQRAKLEQDQDTLNAAKNELVNAKTETEKAQANNKVNNLRGAIQKDQASISQNQTQNTTQSVCDTSTTNNYYTTNTTTSTTGSGAGAGMPSGSSSNSGSGAGDPGLPQTGAAA